MNYGKLTAGTTKTAIDTAKPSEKGEIITYLSRMGDVLHDIEKGCKVVFRLIGAVHAVIDGNEANAVLREGDLRVEAHTEIVTTHATEVFDQDNAHLTGFNVGNQPFPVWTLKIRTAPTVVRINRYIRKISFTGIAREHILLRRDLSRYVFVKECAIRIDKQPSLTGCGAASSGR